MLRYTFYLLHFMSVVSKSSRVAIFPIHLDPPTLQHREIFKLLLGIQDNPSTKSCVSDIPLAPSNEALRGLTDRMPSSSESELAFNAPSLHPISQTSSQHLCNIPLTHQEQEPRYGRLSCGPITQRIFPHRDLFARTLKSNSQLAPFEDIILIPNTRYPISLAHSTNLAALAVLAVRGLPRIHVDFTALEHPDASMPIVYQLTQRYPNCVLVHWLHDAYEMQRWKKFRTIKVQVPLMLLKTINLPVSMLMKSVHSSSKDPVTSVWTPGQEGVPKDNMKRLSSLLSSPNVPSQAVPLASLEKRSSRPELLDRDTTCVTGHDGKNIPTRLDSNKNVSQDHGIDSVRTSLIDRNAIDQRSIPSQASGPKEQDVGEGGVWWCPKSVYDDDNIEVSKSYYNSGSFSWLRAMPHASPIGGLSNVDRTDMYTHYHMQDSRHCEESEGNFIRCDPLCMGKTMDTMDALDNHATDYAVELKDIVVSSDGFVKALDEGHSVKNKALSSSTIFDTDQKSTTYSTECIVKKLNLDELKSICFLMASACTASVPSVEKELAQVRQQLRDACPLTGSFVLQETFQPGDEWETTRVYSSESFQNLSMTQSANSQPRGPFVNDIRLSGPLKRRGQSDYPAVQYAQRKVHELLDELYEPRSYCQNTRNASIVHPVEKYKSSVQAVDALETDADNCKACLKENPSHNSTRTVFGPQRHSEVSESSTTGSFHSKTDATTTSTPTDSHLPAQSLNLPLVEVHSVVRTTGADVRQALWEQEIDPSYLLSDCVLRYIDSYGLYRDSRKSRTNLELKQRHSGLSSFAMHGNSPVAQPLQTSACDGRTLSSSRRLPSSKFQTRVHGSYRNATKVFFESIIPRLEIHYDRNNPTAREKYEVLKHFQVLEGEEPDLIVPIGGDGYMMHCIRQNWRRFIPFYGVNVGHVGYLLNDYSALEELFSHPLMMNSTNMLYCQAEKETANSDGVLLSEMAFNDAWVERASGQAAFIRILVNGEERIKGLRGDGVLVSTAAGSTAYSRAVGASPIPVGVPLMQMVGSNVVSPWHWQPVHLNQEDVVEFEVLDHGKRPCRCFVDSVNLGNILRIQVRTSRVAGVTLVFSNSCDLQQKLFEMQFPKMN